MRTIWLFCSRPLAAVVLAGILAHGVSSGTTIVRADEVHPQVKEETTHEESHDPEGPISANEVDLAIWSLITFIVFVAVLGKFGWGPLVEGLDKRESKVLEHIAQAETARVRAEKMLAEHAKKLEHVQDEVREILAEARRDAEHTKGDIIATAQKEANATRDRAVHEIEQARDQALDQLFDHMAKSVDQATERVLGRALTGPDHDRLIEEALSGFAGRKH